MSADFTLLSAGSQREDSACALSRLAAQLDLPTVGRCNPKGDGQAEPSAIGAPALIRFTAVETFSNPVQVRGRDTYA